jgi:hypothetical protein
MELLSKCTVDARGAACEDPQSLMDEPDFIWLI